MSSRSLDTLDPGTRHKAERFLSLADDATLDVLIYCTLRTTEEQAILYRQSRPLSKIKIKAHELSDTYGRSDLAKILLDVGPQHGAHVTNAGPGQSLHNYGYAFDGVPLRHGKPVWGTRSRADLSLWGCMVIWQMRLDWNGRATGKPSESFRIANKAVSDGRS